MTILKSKKSLNVHEAFGIGLLVGFLWLPILQMNFHIFPDRNSSEKRVLANIPVLKHLSFQAICAYKANFEEYFNDHYGFRNMLVTLDSLINVYWLGISPNKSVIIGKEGWLYFDSQNDGVNFKDYEGQANFTKETVDHIRREITGLDSLFRAMNIHFIFMIVPNKQTVYPEYLPYWVRKGSITRIDQVRQCLENSGVDVIDMQAVMLSNKRDDRQYPLYFRTDSHWTQMGAFLGYERIIEHVRRWFPQVDPVRVENFRIGIYHNNDGGDLASIIGMNGLVSETGVMIIPKALSRAWPVPAPYESMDGRVSQGTEVDDKRLPKIVVFGDSFFNTLFPYVSESFSRSVYLWKQEIDLSVIEQERPDIVIFEVNERYLSIL